MCLVPAPALADPHYVGLRQPREQGEAYYALVDEFIEGVKAVFGPETLVQWEDFGNSTAFHLLEKYATVLPSFNDDIQGTGSVVLSGLISAADHVDAVPTLGDGTYLFYGAGEAAVGIADLIAYAIAARSGGAVTMEEAKGRIWLVDTKGLVTAERHAAEGDKMAHHKVPYAHPAPGEADPEGLGGDALAAIVRRVKASALIGVSTQGGAFSEAVVREVTRLNPRPVVFALSNPTSKAECTARQAYEWSGGTAVFASGSPFDPLDVDLPDGSTKRFVPGQGNNAYIFPALGLAVLSVRMSQVPFHSLFVAANALSAQVHKEAVEATGCVYPPLSTIREVSANIAVAVAEDAYEKGLALEPRPEDLAAHIRAQMWTP